MNRKTYHYWLCQTPGFGAVKTGFLLSIFDDAEAVFHASVSDLEKAFLSIQESCNMQESRNPFSDRDLENLLSHKKNLDNCIKKYEVLQTSGIRFIMPEDEAYPPSFYELYDKPQSLFLKGSLPDPCSRNVSIVGARRCTEYGRGIAYELGRRLVLRGVNVISGMAEGIDGAAHRGAIDGVYEAYKKSNHPMTGMTLALLGGGVDVCYPKCNMDIYKELAMESSEKAFSCGGLISEHGIGTMPLPGQFPMRNRLISAMSDMLIVCEARMKSGSLITADQALEQGKEVFVIPGRLTDPLSEGCNRLISQGAGIITNLDEFIKENFQCQNENGDFLQKMKNKLAINDEMVYSGLDFIPTHINDILNNTGLQLPELLQSLQKLQTFGMISETAKNYYVRKL